MTILQDLPSSPTTSQAEAIERGRDIKAWRRGAQALGVSPDAKAPYRPISTDITSLEHFLSARANVRRTSALDVYTLHDADEVRAFVNAHPVLHPLLEEAPRQIHQFFEGAPLSLEVVRDPEAPQDAQLMLLIHTFLEVDEADALLRALDKSWWLDQISIARGALFITLEYERASIGGFI